MKTVIQIGLGGEAEWADLLVPGKRAELESLVPGVIQSDWEGIFVDGHPVSFSEAASLLVAEYPIEKLTLINACVSSFSIAEMQTRSFSSVDTAAKMSGVKKTWGKRPGDLKFIAGTITLDEIIGLSQHEIGLLGIDVEGAGIDILEGFSWCCYPEYVVVEFHSEEEEAFIMNLLDSHGYTLIGSCVPWNKKDNFIYRREDENSSVNPCSRGKPRG